MYLLILAFLQLTFAESIPVISKVFNDFAPASQSTYGASCFFDYSGINYCPSASLSMSQRRGFFFQSSLIGNQQLLDTTTSLHDQEIDAEEFDRLIGGSDVHYGESAVVLGFNAQTYSIMVIPWQAQMVAKVNNPSLPEVHLVSQVSRELRVTLATWQSLKWSTGVSFRYAQRQVIDDRLDLFEYAVGERWQSQSGDFWAVEPSVNYVVDKDIHFMASVHNFGVVDNDLQDWPIYPSLVTGVGSNTDFNLALLMEWSNRFDNPSDGIQGRAGYDVAEDTELFAVLSQPKQIVGFQVVSSFLELGMQLQNDRLTRNSLNFQFGPVF